MPFYGPAGGLDAGSTNTFTADQTFNDNVNLTFGTGGDVDLDYDGTDLVLNLTVVGAGDFVVNGGSMELDDSEGVTFGTGKDATVQYDGTDLIISPAAVGAGDVHISGGSLELDDSESLTLGTGKDATISYDGTNLVIEPQAVGSGDVVINDAAVLFVNDTANASMTVGMTINQGANDDIAFSLKSSDVDTGITSLATRDCEVDDYFTIAKRDLAGGGAHLQSLQEDDASGISFQLSAWGGAAATGKTTGVQGLIHLYVAEHDGSNAIANLTSNGNVLSIAARVGGANVTRMLVDEDGDLYSVTSAQTFDTVDDLAMVESYDMIRNNMVNEDWQEFIRDHEQTLIDLKVLGAPVVGLPHDEQGLTNITQLQRLHNGAIRQLGAKLGEYSEKIAMLETKMQRLLEAR